MAVWLTADLMRLPILRLNHAQDLAVGGPSDVGQRKVAVESLISLIVRISESHAQLAERLLWVDQEPVQFVKDVSEPRLCLGPHTI